MKKILSIFLLAISYLNVHVYAWFIDSNNLENKTMNLFLVEVDGKIWNGLLNIWNKKIVTKFCNTITQDYYNTWSSIITKNIAISENNNLYQSCSEEAMLREKNFDLTKTWTINVISPSHISVVTHDKHTYIFKFEKVYSNTQNIPSTCTRIYDLFTNNVCYKKDNNRVCSQKESTTTNINNFACIENYPITWEPETCELKKNVCDRSWKAYNNECKARQAWLKDWEYSSSYCEAIANTQEDIIKRWFTNWLTIYKDSKSFKPDNYITRAQAAKIFTIYMEKFYPTSKNINQSCVFSDIEQWVSKDLKSYIIQSCQYNLFRWYKNLFMPHLSLTAKNMKIVLERIVAQSNGNTQQRNDLFWDNKKNLNVPLTRMNFLLLLYTSHITLNYSM